MSDTEVSKALKSNKRGLHLALIFFVAAFLLIFVPGIILDMGIKNSLLFGIFLGGFMAVIFLVLQLTNYIRFKSTLSHLNIDSLRNELLKPNVIFYKSPLDKVYITDNYVLVAGIGVAQYHDISKIYIQNTAPVIKLIIVLDYGRTISIGGFGLQILNAMANTIYTKNPNIHLGYK